MSDLYQDKIKTLDELSKILDAAREQGKRVAHCHGVFDLVHPGHIRHLNSARKHADILVVSITADRFVKRGPGRPVFNTALRAESLVNLAVVDYVVVAEFPTAVECIQALKPEFYVKGPDYADKTSDVTAKVYDEEDAVKAHGGKLVITDDLTFSSSKLINTHIATQPAGTQAYLKACASQLSMDDISAAFERVAQLKVLVIGDTIIDQYHYVEPLGKSSKASIVANKYVREEDFAGGSLAIANHLAELSPQVSLVSALGAEDTFEAFIRSHLNKRITPWFYKRASGVTTVKRRFVNDEGDKHKLFEIVYLHDDDLSSREEADVEAYLEQVISDFDLVVVADYGHGLMTDRLRDVVCANARCLALNVQTNSANIGFNLVTKYTRADYVCIDEQELRLATQDKAGEFQSLVEKVHALLKPKQVVATRGLFGSLGFTENDGFHETPAFCDVGVDAVGAGDAFFAYTAPLFAVGAPPKLIGLVGNAAGALKLQIIGNKEPVKYVDLIKYITRLLNV